MFNYKWNLKDGYPAKGIEKHNLKVFSTFACGGGSTMGYKLAGFNVIGANDIDPYMAQVYQLNHNPSFYYLGSISDLITKDEKDLPKELFDLDILDGSPPCKTFSMAGSREDKWKEDHKYNSRVKSEVISDLFFEFVKLADRLKPKMIVAENVKGMMLGNAKVYCSKVIKQLNSIGYDVQLFLLNSAIMGVPQARERVFFIGRRKDLNFPALKLSFNERHITFGEVEKLCNPFGKEISETYKKLWDKTIAGKSFSTAHAKGSFFSSQKVAKDKVMNTITASAGGKITHYAKPVDISEEAIALCGSWPLDYEYPVLDVRTLTGRSVPPVMMAQLANQIYKQILKK